MATLNIGRSVPGLFPDEAAAMDARPEHALKAGILPAQHIREFIQRGHVSAEIPVEAGQIQPASLDLRLGPVAYRVQASFLPGKMWTVKERITALHMAELDLSKPAV